MLGNKRVSTPWRSSAIIGGLSEDPYLVPGTFSPRSVQRDAGVGKTGDEELEGSTGISLRLIQRIAIASDQADLRRRRRPTEDLRWILRWMPRWIPRWILSEASYRRGIGEESAGYRERGTQRRRSREMLPRLKGGSLFRAVLRVRSLAYRGKLVVTAAQSRSGETVQQDTEKEEVEAEAEARRRRRREKGGRVAGRSYATRTRMSPAASRIYHKKNEWSIRE